MIRQTHEVERTCPECLDELDRYVQSLLDGAAIDGVLNLVRKHLEACPCCHDQLDLVLETLRGTEESGQPESTDRERA